MKKIQRLVGTCLMVAACGLFVASCGGDKKKTTDNKEKTEKTDQKSEKAEGGKLASVVKAEAAKCPKEVTEGITVQGIELDGDVVSIDMECIDAIYQQMAAEGPEAAKKMTLSGETKASVEKDPIFSTVCKEGASIEYAVSNADTDEEFIFVVTSDDLKAIQ